MSNITLDDRFRLVQQVKELESTFGPPKLANVDPNGISPFDVDVVAVGALVRSKDGRSVLVRHAEAPGEWQIPGGTVEPGEDLVDAVVREVREETGLTTKVDAFLRLGLVADYGPPAYRRANLERFGRESVSLLFLNFGSVEIDGALDCSGDPGGKIVEVKAFREVPFASIAHVYKVLFVERGIVKGDLLDYPPVEFDPGGADRR